jgi:formylglycine-generating enzyme
MVEYCEKLQCEMDKLISYPNAHCVYRSKKIVNGIVTDNDCLCILVTKKIPQAELQPQHLIPSTVLGNILTDIVECPQMKLLSECYQNDCAQDPQNKYRPLKGGVSGMESSGTACTIGAIVKDATDNKLVGLTNNHCVGQKIDPRYGHPGEVVFGMGGPPSKLRVEGLSGLQPSPLDGGSTSDIIGIVKRSSVVKLYGNIRGNVGGDCRSGGISASESAGNWIRVSAAFGGFRIASLSNPLNLPYFVHVGDPGNDPDFLTPFDYQTPPKADQAFLGSVHYEYKIGKYPITNCQYVEFLNSVDPEGLNPQEIYTFSMAGTDDPAYLDSGIIFDNNQANGNKYIVKNFFGNKPVVNATWFCAARYCNWLHNGKLVYTTTNATELAPQNYGAYDVGTRVAFYGSETEYEAEAVAVNPSALYFIPSNNEAYKAAYYDPTLIDSTTGKQGSYWRYPTRSNTQPEKVNALSNGDGTLDGVNPVRLTDYRCDNEPFVPSETQSNSANYGGQARWNDPSRGNVTTVGTNGRSSYYGTYDQGGNVLEITDWGGVIGSNIVDGAIYDLNLDTSPDIGMLNIANDQPLLFETNIDARIGQSVYKNGRTTCETQGIVQDTNATILISLSFSPIYAKYTNVIIVYSDTNSNVGPYLAGGDSGSITLTSDNKILGLNFAGVSTSPCGFVAPGLAAACRIDKVAEELQIKPWQGDVVVEYNEDPTITINGRQYTRLGATTDPITHIA